MFQIWAIFILQSFFLNYVEPSELDLGLEEKSTTTTTLFYNVCGDENYEKRDAVVEEKVDDKTCPLLSTRSAKHVRYLSQQQQQQPPKQQPPKQQPKQQQYQRKPSDVNLKTPTIITNTNDFKGLLLDGDVYVDKSLLIKEIVEGPDIISISRPRRTGKSINLNMLHKFFELEVDQKGIPLVKQRQMNYKFFMGGQIGLGFRNRTLRPLKISKRAEIMRYQGAFPVVFLNFTGVNGVNYYEIESNIIRKIRIMYAKHAYLRNTKGTVVGNKKTAAGGMGASDGGGGNNNFNKHEFDKYYTGKINAGEIEYSLCYLTRILSVFYKRKVVLLVDAYDTPMNNAYRDFGDRSEECKKVRLLVEYMLASAIKNSNHLQKVVITGMLRVPRTETLSKSNSTLRSTVLSPKFTRFYGFTQEEVDQLFANIPTVAEPAQIKYVYASYDADNTTVLYNPFSVMECLSRQGKTDFYWAANVSSYFDEGFQADEAQCDLQSLLRDVSVVKTLHDQQLPSSKESESAFFKLLLFEGYLNAIPCRNASSDRYHLLIPNFELKQVFVSHIIQWMTKKLRIGIREYNIFVNLLVHGEVTDFERKFRQYLPTVNSQVFHPDDFYAVIMGGVVSSLALKYSIQQRYLNDKYGYLMEPHEGGTKLLIGCRVGKKDETAEEVI